jgi:hypothetical protein
VDVAALSPACRKCVRWPRPASPRLASWRPTPRSAQPTPAPPDPAPPDPVPPRRIRRHPAPCRLAPIRRQPLPLCPGHPGRLVSGLSRSARRGQFCRLCCGPGLRPSRDPRDQQKPSQHLLDRPGQDRLHPLGRPGRDSRQATGLTRQHRPRPPRRPHRARVMRSRVRLHGRSQGSGRPPRLSVARGSRPSPPLRGRRMSPARMSPAWLGLPSPWWRIRCGLVCWRRGRSLCPRGRCSGSRWIPRPGCSR